MRNNTNEVGASVPSRQAADEVRVDPRFYFGVLLRRWWIFLIFVPLCLMAAAVYCFLADARYESSTRVEILSDNRLAIGPTDQRWNFALTHAALMKSPPVENEVIASLRSDWESKLGGELNLKGKLRADVVENSGGTQLELKLTALNPEYAKLYLEKTLEFYQKYRAESEAGTTTSAIETLQKETDNLAAQIEETEQELLDFQRKNNMTYRKEKDSIEGKHLADLLRKIYELKTEQIILESQIPALKNLDPNSSADIVDLAMRGVSDGSSEFESTSSNDEEGNNANSTKTVFEVPKNSRPDQWSEDLKEQWKTIQSSRLSLLEKIKEFETKYTEQHPKMIDVRAKLQEHDRTLEIQKQVAIERLQGRYAAILKQQEALEKAAVESRQDALISAKKNGVLERLNMKQDNLRKLYATLFNRLEISRTDMKIQKIHFKQMSKIYAKPTPVWPSYPKIFIAAFCAGMFFSVVSIFGLQMLDNTVTSIADFEHELNIPLIGVIPFWVDAADETELERTVWQSGLPTLSEAYRTVNVGLLERMNELGTKTVMMTSCDTQDGKTLTCINLAMVMAQAGYRTLLVDADLRRGRIHNLFSMASEPGFTDAIADAEHVVEAFSTPLENLYFIPRGKDYPNISQLLHSSKLFEVVSSLRDAFDVVIFDSAPIMQISDSSLLSKAVENTVVVARAEVTPLPILKFALLKFDQSKILGVILNGLPLHKLGSSYYSYQYPSYAYYGKGYADTGQVSGKTNRKITRKRKAKNWFKKTFLPID